MDLKKSIYGVEIMEKMAEKIEKPKNEEKKLEKKPGTSSVGIMGPISTKISDQNHEIPQKLKNRK